ncbi:MAG: sensor histidine kinase [Sphingobacteriia bacterium]|nr:MAG: sensor histidine kinase [Sphingobacteriia bacterium]
MIKPPFRNLSIRNKLFLSHFLILLINLVIISITLKVNDKRILIEKLMNHVESIQIKIHQQNEAKLDFLLNDRLDEAFYINGNCESITQHNHLLLQIDQAIKSINKHPLSKKNIIAEQILSITKNIHLQDELFNQLIDSVKQLGFGNMGLSGILPKYSQELGNSKLINTAALTALKLQEDLFFLHRNENAVLRFDSIANRILLAYQNSPSTLLILGEYQKTFKRMVKLEHTIGLNKKSGIQNELFIQTKRNEEQLQHTIDAINNIYEADLKKLEWIFLGSIAVTFIGGLLLSYMLSVEITNPLIILNKAIKEVVATKFKDDINPRLIDQNRKDEIGQLAFNFNLAIRKIRRSIRIIQDKTVSLETKNKQLIENEETLKLINAQKDKFLSIISHDMRAPLSSIISFLDYYKDNFTNFTAAEIDFVSTNLSTHVKKVVEMLDELLMWSRAQTGEIQVNLQPIDLTKIITDTVEILNQSAVNKKITITTDIHSQLIWGDKNMTAFIIRNIISNAIKFTHENGNILINTKRNKINAFVTIKDSGVGMSPENLGKLFQGNTSFSTFGTAEEKGIGLGLVLCKDFLDKQNGSIEIDSAPESGTTVNLLFPIVGKQ